MRGANLKLVLALAALLLAALGAARAAEAVSGATKAAAPAPALETPPGPQVLAPAPPTPPAPIGPGPVYVLKITDEDGDGAISKWNVGYIGRCLEQARKERAAMFVIQLTTGGGSVSIVSRMAEVISDAKDIRTVMYVKGEAFSAGALVALACDDIYMEPGSVIGAATPIVIIPGEGLQKLPDEIKEKFTRAAATQFEAIARKKGHSPVIAAAMVDAALEVLAIRRKPGGPVELVNRQEYDKLAPRLSASGAGLELVEVVNDDKKLLVFTDKEAVEWGLARGSPPSLEGLLKAEGVPGRQTIVITATLSDVLGRFFSSAVVISLLIAAAMLALYIELNHPSGVAAGFFLLALGLYFWAHFMAGTANALSIVLVLIGAAFLAVEIFFFPGFGVPGIIGAGLVVIGLVAARIPPDFFSPPDGGGGGGGSFAIPWEELLLAALPVLTGLLLGIVGIIALMRFFPRLPLLNRLVLQSDLSGAVVTAAGPAGVERPEQLVGLTGTAATTLRPGGSARFGAKLLDVISDGEFLEAGTAVRIVSADSNRIIVRRA